MRYFSPVARRPYAARFLKEQFQKTVGSDLRAKARGLGGTLVSSATGAFAVAPSSTAVGERGGTLKIGQRHKQEMTTVIASLLPASTKRKLDTQAIALAVDGAIVRAQFDETPDAALKALARILKSIRPRTIRS